MSSAIEAKQKKERKKLDDLQSSFPLYFLQTNLKQIFFILVVRFRVNYFPFQILTDVHGGQSLLTKQCPIPETADCTPNFNFTLGSMSVCLTILIYHLKI